MDREQLLDVLSEFARTMVTDFAIQGTLDHFVSRIVDVMPIKAAGVTLISRDLDPHYVAASSGFALRFEKLQTELREGPCLAAYQTGEAISMPDLRIQDRFPRFAPRALEAGLGAAFAFPLRHGASQLGALDLYEATPGALSDHAMTAAQTLADTAAAYLLTAQARTKLQSSSDRASEAQSSSDRASEVALHDTLTRLPNRALMLERLRHAFVRGRGLTNRCAVIFVDLDRFKAINDTYGHRAGDELLVAFADRLTNVLRPGDTIARISGDDFVILCEDLDADVRVDAIAIRIHAALSLPFVVSGTDLTVTASVGIAFTGSGGDAPEQLIHDAGRAMYRMKHSNGDGRRVFDLRDATDRRSVYHAVTAEPEKALSPRELEVLLMIAEGAANAEVAARLVIADTTVQSHVQHILRKLGARNRTEAVARYLRG